MPARVPSEPGAVGKLATSAAAEPLAERLGAKALIYT